MGTVLSRMMSEDALRDLAANTILHPKFQLQKQIKLDSPHSSSQSPAFDMGTPVISISGSNSHFTNSPPLSGQIKSNNANQKPQAGFLVGQAPSTSSPGSKSLRNQPIANKKATNPQAPTSKLGNLLGIPEEKRKELKSKCPPRSELSTHSGKIFPPKSSSNNMGNATTSTSAKSLSKTKSKMKKVVKTMNAMNSREILQEALGEEGILDNIHPVDITAMFGYRPEYTATFHYTYNPATKEEVLKTNCGRDKLVKMDIPLDKNGNVDPSQFIKALIKLSAKFEGVINLNGYKITIGGELSRRLRIVSIDIRSNPMIVQLSPKGIKGVTVLRSHTKLEIRGETEFGVDHDKKILFEGQNSVGIKIYSPEGKGKLFVCIPTFEGMDLAQRVITASDNSITNTSISA